MAHFFIQSIATNGRRKFYFLQSEGYDKLIKRLERDKEVPLKITQMPKMISMILPDVSKRVSADEVIELMDSLHLVIRSNLPIHQGLADLAQDSDNKRFKEMLYYIADVIDGGGSLYDAFKSYEKVVGKIILNLIQIGEQTGQLETTLKRASEFLKRVRDLKKKAKSALIYPAFALVATTAAMLVWLLYVLPKMTSLFKDMDVKLPTLTIWIIRVSDFLTNYIWYILITIVTLIITFIFLHKKYQKVRFFTDKMLLKIPAIKQVISGFNIAFIIEYLRLALISGVPIFDALQTLKTSVSNELFKKALIEATDEVSKGSQISQALGKTTMFTPFSIRMIAVGESTGDLDAQFETISTYYYEKVDYYAENMGKFIEPAVLIFVGGFMALIIAGLISPMYDLISQVK